MPSPQKATSSRARSGADFQHILNLKVVALVDNLLKTNALLIFAVFDLPDIAPITSTVRILKISGEILSDLVKSAIRCDHYERIFERMDPITGIKSSGLNEIPHEIIMAFTNSEIIRANNSRLKEAPRKTISSSRLNKALPKERLIYSLCLFLCSGRAKDQIGYRSIVVFYKRDLLIRYFFEEVRSR
jgi:hypothetical protein